MKDVGFDRFQAKVHETIKNIDPLIIPASWYETVMRYYYEHGFTVNATTQTILETVGEKAGR